MITGMTITDINFEPDGTTIITFIDTTDVRCGGAVAVRKSVRIVPTEQYAPDLDKLISRAKAVLSDALEDWAGSEPVPMDQLGPAHPERPFESERPPPINQDDLDQDEDATAARNWEAIEQAKVPAEGGVPAADDQG